IAAADAGRLLERALDAHVAGNVARNFGSASASASDIARGLSRTPVKVIAAGKAAPAMARAAARLLGDGGRIGLGISGSDTRVPDRFELIVGGHPIPTTESERGGRRALAIAQSIEDDETLLVLLSGGASALMAVPAAGVTLDDKRRTTDRLLKSGADIHALNAVRKHLSAIKGGWLAAARG